MRRWLIGLLVVACLVGLVIACYGRAIFQGEQFAYRDAASYYYPLHQRIQAEWEAGRWPLWEPEENGGMPLLGNPTAAVLYPGKVVFALFSYPLAARLYVIGHSVLAWVAMLALLRHWGVSWVGATLGSQAYAFSGPILFQSCNVIYLVGAAWLPLGFRAVDRWLRQGHRFALVELAVVLAMQVLGGDPQSAYLTGVCALGLAVVLSWSSRKGKAVAGASEADPKPRRHRRKVVGALALLLAFWIIAVLASAAWLPGFRPARAAGQPRAPLPWSPWVGPVVALAWVLVGLVLFLRWRRQKEAGAQPTLTPKLLGLIAAAALAAAIAAAQLLPVLEFVRQSGRASAESGHSIYPFSLTPLRVVELLWPGLFGTIDQGNKLWVEAVPPRIGNANLWVPTLYLGALTLVLALGGARSRSSGGEPSRDPRRVWLAWIAAISLLGSLGEYGSPLWLARLAPGASDWIGSQGLTDPETAHSLPDLQDGDGGVYWLLATALPGFSQFRYPSKLLTFTIFALACLAAQGWDALASGDARVRRRVAAWSIGFLTITLTALALSLLLSRPFRAWLEAQEIITTFGPLDVPGALAETRGALIQATLVLAFAIGLCLRPIGRFPWVAAALAMVVTTADLAWANASLVRTAPQALMETTPEVASIIERAEQEEPSTGPYRVHRMPLWGLAAWKESSPPDRLGEVLAWSRDTLEPKFGINFGIHYTLALGVTELYDYRWFFGGFYFGARDRAARTLRIEPGTRIIAYPRRAFDLWGTRYFVLPYYNRWDDGNRGVASFLERTEPIYPPPDLFEGPGGEERSRSWAVNRDFQVRRNLDAYPRAWIVHDSRPLPSFSRLDRAGRDQAFQEMLFSNDMTWPDPDRVVYDPRRFVWLETRDRAELAAYLDGGYPSAAESVRVTRYEPDFVELEASLERPGVVVLADVDYPGWTLTIDGQAAPIYRVNGLMRGAAVDAGRHTLIYRFRPASFRLGLVVSGFGLVALGGLGLWSLGWLRLGEDRRRISSAAKAS